MKYKNIMMLAIIFTCILAISAVSATDNTTNDVLSVKTSIYDSSLVDDETDIVSIQKLQDNISVENHKKNNESYLVIDETNNFELKNNYDGTNDILSSYLSEDIVTSNSTKTSVVLGGTNGTVYLKDQYGIFISGALLSYSVEKPNDSGTTSIIVKSTIITNETGYATIPLYDIPKGNYKVRFSYDGNEQYNSQTFSMKLTIVNPIILKKDTMFVSYGGVITLYDADYNIIPNVPVSCVIYNNESVIVKKIQGRTNANGYVDFDKSDIPNGEYILSVSFEESTIYKASNSTTSFDVDDSNTKETVITASAVSTVYNGGKYLVVTLKDIFGNNVNDVKISVVLNGKTISSTTKNGQIKVSTNGLAPKTSYTAKITFAGNNNYVQSTTSVNVKVTKATPKLTAKAKTLKRSDKTKKYTVTLKTNQNKVMKNTEVTVKVNKKTYTAKTNAKGVATFKLTKLTKNGKYTATVKYAGSKYYNSKTVKAKITVK